MSMQVDVSQSPAGIALPPLPSDALWRMSLEKYHELISQGIFTEDDPVELWEGVLVRKMPKSRPHCLATELVRDALTPRIPPGWHLESQESITLSESEFEPDLMIVRGAARDYAVKNPGAADLALVIEIADSTLARDQGFKKAVYAKAGIAVYWIVNLVDHRIAVFGSPVTTADVSGYEQHQEYAIGNAVPIVIGGREVSTVLVRELLP